MGLLRTGIGSVDFIENASVPERHATAIQVKLRAKPVDSVPAIRPIRPRIPPLRSVATVAQARVPRKISPHQPSLSSHSQRPERRVGTISKIPARHLDNVSGQNGDRLRCVIGAHLAFPGMLDQHRRLARPVRRAAGGRNGAHDVQATRIRVGTRLFDLSQDVKRAEFE